MKNKPTNNNLENKIKDLENRVIKIEKQLNSPIDNKTNFNSESYKVWVNKNDLDKVINFQKNETLRWYYFVPIFGTYIWLYFVGKLNESLDRGFIKTELYRWIRYWLCFLIFIAIPVNLIFNFLPLVYRNLVIPKVISEYNKNKNE